MNKSFQFFSLGILFFFISQINTFAQLPDWKSKVSTALLSRIENNSTVDFIVVMNEQADLSAVKNIHGKEAKGNFVFETLQSLATNSQQQIISDLKNSNITYHSFWVVNAITVSGDFFLVEKLAARNDVKQILNNTELSYSKPVSEKEDYARDLTIPWGVDSIHAPAVWQMGIKGAGVVVGGQDTGYDWEHPAIKNQYRGWNGISVDNNYNWHDAIHAPDPKNVYPNPCGIDIKSPCDDYGHGTHTMGTMIGADGTLRIGIAPEAKWIGERNMEQGWGNLASYIEAFEWFIAPTDTNNLNADVSKAPHVINNSWVCTGEEGCDVNNFSVMEEVVKNVKASGIVVVASAGNSGPYCNTINLPPAIFEASFSIGAIDSTMTIAGFSSRGNVTANNSGIMKPNVAAPGVDVYSSIPGGGYAYYSGTSMAGPHTAGTVALVICANPLLAGETDVIENIIEGTAHAVTTVEGCGGDGNTSIPNNTYGWGIIDALAAVQEAMVFTADDLVSSETGIHVFPTVTTNFMFVNFETPVNDASLRLFTITGQQISTLKFSAEENTIQLSALPSGIYLYQAQYNGITKSGKIVKQ